MVTESKGSCEGFGKQSPAYSSNTAHTGAPPSNKLYSLPTGFLSIYNVKKEIRENLFFYFQETQKDR